MGVVDIDPKPCVKHENRREDIAIEPVNKGFSVELTKVIYGGHKFVGTSCNCPEKKKGNTDRTNAPSPTLGKICSIYSYKVLSLLLDSNVKTYAMRLAKFH